MFHWKNCIRDDSNYLGDNVHSIHPLAQNDVNLLIKELKLKGAKGIVYIFGSAITPMMNPWSDIDVGFDTTLPPRYVSLEYAFDKIDLKDEDYKNSDIYKDILGGVKISL